MRENTLSVKGYLNSKDLILQGDVWACLDLITDNSIAVVITSPPYWKQRDYKFDGQIGQENTPEEYIGRLVTVFDKLKQKLRNDGVFFLNVGDKYLSRYGKSHLLQIPYRLAYHLLKNGWRLEDIIIWYKPNHLPSSVKDRFTNSYEPILVLSKSETNKYKKELGSVIKVPLEQTPWKHTAVFPERLVEELLNRVNLNNGDIVLDPFAGSGTVGAVINKIKENSIFTNIHFILIEKKDEFVEIIVERVAPKRVEKVIDTHYRWDAVKEGKLPSDIEPKIVNTNKYGEVFIAESSTEFLMALKGITTEEFNSFHREDALYFFGVKKWTILDLYYIHSIIYDGYILRNMIVVSDGKSWYPVFMFARDSTKTRYRFYLDNVRIQVKTRANRNWQKENFVGKKVRDISGKETREGKIIKVFERYEDGFPQIVAVQWDECVSIEIVLHPDKDEFIIKGLIFKCPKCGNKLEMFYDTAVRNKCIFCGAEILTNLETLPVVEEPKEIIEITEKLKSINYNYSIDESNEVKEFGRNNKEIKSKFMGLDRLNWGASPGARKLILGEYFTKTRLYKLEQNIVAYYLGVIRKCRGLTIQDVINKFPDEYRHTVAHWFRTDLGGSIPLPEDIPLLKKCLNAPNGLLDILQKTALKFQTVKSSTAGKNPGDFLEGLNDQEIANYFEKVISS